MALKKGGIYNEKTGTYFVGGQGYSTPTNPNIPQNPLTKAIDETAKKKKSSGGGGQSGGGVSTPATSPTTTPAQTTTQTSTVQPTPQQQALTQEQKVIIARSGEVRMGRHTYVGNAMVGDTGKTANQFQQELRQQYKKETGKGIGGGRISGEVTYTTTTTQERPPSSNVFSGGYKPSTSYGFGEGTGIEVNALGGIKEINPQGYSYQDVRTGRGYEVTPFRVKKLPAGKLVEFNEAYYGVSDKINNAVAKIGSISVGKTNVAGIFTSSIPSPTSTRVPKNKAEAIGLKLYEVLKPEYILASAITPYKFPKKLIIPERNLASASVSKEVAVTVTKGGKQVRIANYNLYTEVKPPRIVLGGNKGGGLLGMSDDLVRLPSQSVKTTTPFRVIGQKEFLTFNAKNLKYGKVIGVERVTPVESRAISISEYSSLPKQDKFLLQRLVEARVGKPVSLKLVPKFLNEKNIYVRSSLEVEKAGRVVKVKTGEYNVLKSLSKDGLKIKRFTTISEVSETGESNLFKLYKVDTMYKDVTMPFSRATGKTSRLITRGAELKEPLVLDAVKEVNAISPANIIKTPMSKTFAEQIVQQTITKPLPSIPKTKLTPVVKTAESTYAVQGVSQTSRYAGTGMYERTEGGTMPSFKLPSLLSQPNIRTNTITTTSTMNLFKQEPITKSSSSSKNIFREVLLPREITAFEQKPVTRTIEIQKVTQKQRVIQKQKALTKSFSSTRGFSIQTFKGKEPIVPRPFKLNFKDSNISSKSLRLEVKQKGKWNTLGTSSNVKQLTMKGMDITGRSIARSFRIKGTNIPIPKGYRYSRKKGQKDVFVELSRTSISQRGERNALRGIKI